MPILREFNTQSVRPWYKPTPDTRTTLTFPRPFVAPPRLAHGLCRLDVDCGANIRVKSVLQDINKSSADCHIESWAGTTLYGGTTHVFALAPSDLEFLTGEHMRTRHDASSVHINFERAFVTPPKVVVFFNYIDLDKDRNWRLFTTATDVDVKGFTLNIETWADTIFYAAKVCWIAYPEDRKHIFSASLNTLDTHPPAKLEKAQCRKVKFDDVEFWKEPDVFVALNYMDVGCGANLRIDADVDSVSKTSMVLHLGPWSDTTLYSAGVSIIAFN